MVQIYQKSFIQTVILYGSRCNKNMSVLRSHLRVFFTIGSGKRDGSGDSFFYSRCDFDCFFYGQF